MTSSGRPLRWFKRELMNHQVSLQMELAPALPVILADRVQLQQVLINLVMNGIEAMQSVTDRPRELLIRSRQDEKELVLASVADCGVGISAENADRLLPPSSPPNRAAWVWGLSICRSIIEAHGGPAVGHGKSAPRGDVSVHITGDADTAS